MTSPSPNLKSDKNQKNLGTDNRSRLHFMRRFTFLIMVVIVITIGWFFNRKISTVNSNSPSRSAVKDENDVPDYSGIQVTDVFKQDLQDGTGASVKFDSHVVVTYEAWVYDPAALGNKGKLVFSKDKNQNVSFSMTDSKALEGFKKGLLGLKIGGLRQIVVPPHLGYGDAGLNDLVPPKAMLLFEVKL